jgi:hypothetical protein
MNHVFFAPRFDMENKGEDEYEEGGGYKDEVKKLPR